MAITAAEVKALREKTGAPMMDCKKALAEANGDADEAVKILRTKGLATAAKRSGRATSDGRVQCMMSDDGRKAVLVQVNCETDFVARGDDFIAFVEGVCRHALGDASKAATAEELAAEDFSEAPGTTVGDALKELIGKLGENMALGAVGRLALPEGKQGVIGSYIHSNSKVGVILSITSDGAIDAEKAGALAKDLCMQTAAMRPVSVSRDKVPADVLEREKEVYRAQVKDKPDNMVEKIVTGKLNKFFQECCLVDQKFVKDDKKSVGKVVDAVGKEMGAKLTVEEFVRFAIGD